MKLSEMLVAKVGEDIRPNSTMAQIAKRVGVSRTSEFKRIENLPRRKWQDIVTPEVVQDVTDYLKTPNGTMTFKPIQAAAIIEIHDYKGAFLPVGVGKGKALMSLMAATVLEAKRPLLIVPADLREQTIRKVIPEMGKHWRLNPNLRVISYSELPLAHNANLLPEMRPDLIILDECHKAKNVKSGTVRRLHRYMSEHPYTQVVAMSGTVSNRSLRDYWHLCFWCLKETLTPLPLKWTELCAWADAIDEGVANPMDPGALLEFCEPEDEGNVRKGYRRRLTETPGVVASGDEELGVSLVIRKWKAQATEEVWATMSNCREIWEDPNGDPITEAVALWRLMRQLALGFWYRWDPLPPEDWMTARREWKRFVRHTISYNRRGLDTELQVWNDQAKKPGTEFLAWSALKDTFEPNVVTEWIDTSIFSRIKDWLTIGDGIVWVEHTSFGERAAKELGIPYFGAGKKASSEILDASGPIIASIAAHGTGKNLQQWNRNLITSPPASGKIWEQLLGRTHRMGQQADTVTCDVLLHAPELINSFEQALADARYLEDSLGGRQKLNYADITFDTYRE